ncbi:Rid family hydrolase [Bosea sp. Tri-44]|uniref:Rid family hydrolase n=1 Tax=Bosea sp. Tri-44 TaxID=1972137 RepID=UPI0019D7052E|nr:Rid family hydrolase [Bosea sp. Tri-44]
MSPAILSGGFAFPTGVTGGDAEGRMPEEAEAQVRNVFRKIGLVLAEAGLDSGAVVEMTSYHVGLRQHFALFDRIRLEHMSKPFAAWTAVEVAGLRREGARVEVRVIAAVDAQM